MELWPAIFKTSSGSSAEKSQTKSKATSREAGQWTNYPVVDHGGIAAATLTKTEDSFQWEFIHSQKNTRRLRHVGEAAKIFPQTRPKSVSNAGIGLRQRAEQGAKYLRTYHPDVDISFELIQDELDFDDSIAKSRDSFDPFQGNTLSATSHFQNNKRKKGFLLAFPTGDVGRHLNISPVHIKNYSLVFQPSLQPIKKFSTPICQIITSSPATQLVPRKEHYLAVRTYGEVFVFDIKSQYAPASKTSTHPITLSEILTIRPSEVTGGRIMDMYLSTSSPAELYAATDQGIVYHCTQKGERQIIKPVFNHQEHDSEDFWRICTDNTPYGGIVATTKVVKRFDSRFGANSIDLLTQEDERNVITSICPSEIDHIYCIGTTKEVLWIDDRFPKHPLLGWKHHRAYDRSLSVQSIGLGDTSLAVLSSTRNNISTAISVKKITDRPMQAEMSSQALPQILHGLPVVGRAIIRHPRLPGLVDSFSMFEMCEQGSVHHREFEYSRAANPGGQEKEPDSFFKYQWSDGVAALNEKSKTLTPDYGSMGAREFVKMDLSNLYEYLFGEEANKLKTEIEEQNPDAVYETLDRMSSFWQRSEDTGDHMHTLFDVAFGSGEKPLREARADFLTGSTLNSVRGYRARRQGKLPAGNVQNKAAWHASTLDNLKRLAPNDFEDLGNIIDTERLDLYEISREEENPVADHKDTTAREQLALDLALSMDVYSSTAIKSTLSQQEQGSVQASELEQEPSALLSKATEQMTLSQKEPPPVSFSYFRPVNKDGRGHYKVRMPVPEPLTEEEDRDVEMPLGVRLLLSEWTVGDNPQEYNYVDPYDLDGSEAQSQLYSQQQAERWGRMRRAATEDANEATQHPTQSQAPPTIVAAKTLASTQPAKVPTVARSKTQTQPAFSFSQQTLVNETPSSQPLMMNTQVLPGPFGGRPAGSAKKKSAKRRIGGF